MSFDTKLTKRCDHWVIDEDHVVESDLRTVHLDQAVSNNENLIVRVNGVKWNKNNKSEILTTDDVSSQINGTNNKFVVSKIPIYDGSNKRRLAQRNVDVTVIVKIQNEDVTPQFSSSGTDKLIVTQHRPLISNFNIYSVQLTSNDVVVEVDSGTGYQIVEIDHIESNFGKIFLKESPLIGSNIRVSYNYKSRVTSFNADSGMIEVRETPKVGDIIEISYYHLTNDGWVIQNDDEIRTSKIVFDRPKQTNHILITNENVSNQFIGIPNKTKFTTKNKNLIPTRVKPNSQNAQVLPSHIVILHNGFRISPVSIDAKNGIINLGFTPKKTDVITITYYYRSEQSSDIISVDYLVSINKCRKCKRTGQVNDFDHDKLGETIIVQKEQKMLQDLLKMTLAIKGSNKAHPWRGTSFMSFLGTTRLSSYYETKFKGELIELGEKIKDLQTQQAQYQQVDNEEFFSFLDNITVQQSSIDPNFYEINADVISQAGTSISLDTSLYFSKPLIEKE